MRSASRSRSNSSQSAEARVRGFCVSQGQPLPSAPCHCTPRCGRHSMRLRRSSHVWTGRRARPHWPVVSDTMIPTADLLLRGGAFLLLALLATLVLRDHGRVAAGWLGSLFAAGTAAFTLCSAPGMHERLGWWSAPILAGASGNNLVFWLFARALFDDGFRPRLWHGVLCLAIVAAAVIEVLMLAPASSPAAAPLGIALTAQTVLFAILGGVQAVVTWRGDLVEPRRRLGQGLAAPACGRGQEERGALVHLIKRRTAASPCEPAHACRPAGGARRWPDRRTHRLYARRRDHSSGPARGDPKADVRTSAAGGGHVASAIARRRPDRKSSRSSGLR